MLKNSITDLFASENDIKNLLEKNITESHVLQKLNSALEMAINTRRCAQILLTKYKSKYPDRVLQWELEERKTAYGKDKNV